MCCGGAGAGDPAEAAACSFPRASETRDVAFSPLGQEATLSIGAAAAAQPVSLRAALLLIALSPHCLCGTRFVIAARGPPGSCNAGGHVLCTDRFHVSRVLIGTF